MLERSKRSMSVEHLPRLDLHNSVGIVHDDDEGIDEDDEVDEGDEGDVRV